MNREDIARIIAKLPELNEFGIGLLEGGKGMSATEKKAALRRGREALRDSADVCTAVCGWLANKSKTKQINKSINSHGLKHIAAEEIGRPVSNGALIVAAIFSGFDYKLMRNNPNVHFNISGASL